MDAHTDLYCIFGNPVGHSKSPVIHNACFQFYQLNSAYLAFEIEDITEGVRAIQALGIKGASVTIPFKESVMECLDEISEEAQKIGAVNTIVNRSGKLFGHNTDCMAAISPLKPHGIDGKTVMVIGAGGAAQAVAWGIKKEGGDLLITNRSHAKGKKMASRFQGDFISLDALSDLDRLEADIIINTTSVGMHPNVNECPLPSGLIRPSMIVMDVVYTPLETRLLEISRETGCITIDGLSMFLHQGAAQFKLWTGILPEIEIMRQAFNNGEK